MPQDLAPDTGYRYDNADPSHAHDYLLPSVLRVLDGSGARYGFDEDALYRDLSGRGFETFRYRPFERVLELLHGARSGSGNTLYVRDAGWLAERVRSAPRWTVRDAWWVGLQSDRGV
jgi:hypothetical protein